MVMIDSEKCIQCGLCACDCPARLISKQEDGMHVGTEGCIQCGHCLSICPQNAVSMTEYDMDEVEPVLSDESRLDPNTLLKAMKSRRSVRHFKNTPVEKEKLLQIIESGRYSPTGSNRQGVKYFLFTEGLEDLKEKTIDALCDILVTRPPEVEPYFLKRYEKRWPEMRYAYQKQGIDTLFYHAPAVLVITGNNKNDKVDAALAASNAELMTYALGLGCVYVGFFEIASRTEPIRNYLNLADDQSVICCLAIGYPDVKYFRTAPKKKADITFR